MPNGGDVPSCPFCQYAERSTESGIWECKKHDFLVPLAGDIFCGDLSHPDWPGMAQGFISGNNIPKSVMYMWAGVYSHQDFPLAPIEIYVTWSEEEKRAHFRAKSKAWEEEYRSKHDLPA